MVIKPATVLQQQAPVDHSTINIPPRSIICFVVHVFTRAKLQIIIKGKKKNLPMWSYSMHCLSPAIVLGPLQSVMQDLHSDDNDEDSEEDDDDYDMDSDVERPAHTHLTHHPRRLVSAHNRPACGTQRHKHPILIG